MARALSAVGGLLIRFSRRRGQYTLLMHSCNSEVRYIITSHHHHILNIIIIIILMSFSWPSAVCCNPWNYVPRLSYVSSAFFSGDSRNFSSSSHGQLDAPKFYRKFREVSIRPREFLDFFRPPTNLHCSLNNDYRH